MKRLLSASLSFMLALALAAPGRVFAENPEKDPDQIGNRDVGKGVNFYSLEKEIALGKQLPKWSARPRSSMIRSSPNTSTAWART
jgi:hypothetical protein